MIGWSLHKISEQAALPSERGDLFSSSDRSLYNNSMQKKYKCLSVLQNNFQIINELMKLIMDLYNIKAELSDDDDMILNLLIFNQLCCVFLSRKSLLSQRAGPLAPRFYAVLRQSIFEIQLLEEGVEEGGQDGG